MENHTIQGVRQFGQSQLDGTIAEMLAEMNQSQIDFSKLAEFGMKAAGIEAVLAVLDTMQKKPK